MSTSIWYTCSYGGFSRKEVQFPLIIFIKTVLLRTLLKLALWTLFARIREPIPQLLKILEHVSNTK